MITKEKWDALIKYNKTKSEIEDYMNEVIKSICLIYDGELNWWCHYGAAEGQVGEIQNSGDSLNIEVKCSNIESELYYEDDDYKGYLFCEFPVHFLFLSLNEIQKRVKANKKKVDDEIKKEEKQKAKQKADKIKTINKAKKKLTKKERDALGIG